MTSEERIASLEQRIAQLERAIKTAVTGPRGPAGDISAAVVNAEKAAQKVIADALADVDRQITAKIEEATKRIMSKMDTAQLHLDLSRQQLEGLQSWAKTQLEHDVAAHVVSICEEYGVVSANDGKPITRY